jgi:hypothetical protein
MPADLGALEKKPATTSKRSKPSPQQEAREGRPARKSSLKPLPARISGAQIGAGELRAH